ncbi:MAG: hypothetical protein ACI4FZ_00390 [Lachnospiraceae bacterium]
MSNAKYNIEMKTPVGMRYGTMNFCSSENQVSGTLHLLGHSEPFNGAVDNEGNCTIRGRLITLMRTIDYIAVGKVSQKAIELSLQGERNKFTITGIAVPESEVDA